MRLFLAGVTVELGGSPIVDGVDLKVAAGEMVGLVGPNGSGKTTLLRAVYRSVRLVAGTIAISGTDLAALSQREVALRAAVVAQESGSEFDFSAEEVVALGRVPHQGPFDRESATDRDAIAAALVRTGMADYRSRRYSTLSGGEKQRVLVARALAQSTALLLLDEPTNHLDVNAALDLLELVRTLDLSVLCVLHDLNLAAAYCDRLYVLNAGTVAAEGRPEDVLSTDLMREVFGVEAHRLTHPSTGRLLLAVAPVSSQQLPHSTGKAVSSGHTGKDEDECP